MYILKKKTNKKRKRINFTNNIVHISSYIKKEEINKAEIRKYFFLFANSTTKYMKTLEF